MRWIRTGLIGISVLAGVIAVLVILLLTVDLGRFKSLAEDLVSSQITPRLQIDGLFQASVSKEIHLVAEDIWLDNPDWVNEQALVRAHRLDVSVNTWSLITGQILIENIELDEVAIHLEQDGAGLNNWTLLEPDPDQQQDDSGAALDLLIRHARISELAINYVDPGQESPIRFYASAINQTQLESGDLQLGLTGYINDTPVTLNGTAGTFANLLAAGPAHYDLAIAIGEINISSTAQIDNLSDPRIPVGQLEVSGPNAEYLTDVLGIAPVTRGPLNLVANIGPAADKTGLRLQGKFGEFEIDVAASFSDLQNFDDAQIDFSAAGPDAATFGELAGLDQIPPDPYSLDGTVRRDGDSIAVEGVEIKIGETEFLLSATVVDLNNIDGSVASVQLDGPDFGRFNKLLGLPGKLTGPFSLAATLSQSPEGVELVDLTANTRDIQFNINGSVSTEPEFVGSEFALRLRGDDLSVITSALDIADVPSISFDASARASRSVRGFVIDAGVVNLGGDVIRLDGVIGAAPLEGDTDITFEVSGPDLGNTLKLLEMDPEKIPDGRYRAGGRVFQEDATFVLEQIVATLGSEDDYRVQVDGRVSDSPDFVGTSLRVSAKGASLQEVARIADVAGLPATSFEVSASVDRLEAGVAISDGKARLADDRLVVEGLVGNQPLERDTNLRFQISGPDLARSLSMAGVELEGLPPGSYEAAGRLRRNTDYFDLNDITARLGDTRAQLNGRLGNLDNLQGTNLDITVKGPSLAGLAPENSDFTLADVPFDVAANVQLADDTLKVRGLKAGIGTGKLTGDFSLGMSPMLSSGRIELATSGPDAAELLPSFSEYVPASDPFDLTSSVRWQDTHVTIDQFSLRLAEGRIVAEGAVDVLNNLSRTNLRIETQIASLSILGRIAGTDLPDEPLSLSAHLVGSGKTLRLDELLVTAGKSDLSGTATYDMAGDVPQVDVGLTSKYLDVSPYLPKKADNAVAEPAPPAKDESRVIPDTPIPMDLLKQLNARVDISIGELAMPETTLNNVLLDGSLQSGALRIDKFGLAEKRGTLAGNLEMLPTANGAQVSAAIDGNRLTLGLTPAQPNALDSLPVYDVQLKLAATGATVRDMAASLDGTVRLVGGSGHVAGMPGWFARDLLAEVTDTVNPFSKHEEYTQIQCFTVLLRSVEGQVDGQPALVLQTDKLNILGVAFIDLGTEKIDVKFETAARKGIGIGAADFITPFTKVSGTMAKPVLAFDTEEAIKRGSVTAATLGASWITKKVKNRFFSSKDPCGKEVAAADEEMRNLGNK